MLLDTLINRQQEMEETDRAFAQRLDIPRSSWQLARTRVKPLSRKAAHGAKRAFPDLAPEVDAFLLSDGATTEASAAADVA